VAILVFANIHAQELQTSIYGYLKLDIAYDNHLSSHGNFIMYVEPQSQQKSAHTLSFTARQTRLGVQLMRDKTKGIIEIDFYGGGTENKNSLALRKAYVDIPLGPTMLRAGQAIDLIAPLNPTSTNYTVGYGAGNIGYRRPQLAIFITQMPYTFALGITRSLSSDLNADAIPDGDASGVPTIQTRTALQFSKFAIGASAHYGLLNAPGTAQEEYATWSINIDGKFDLSSQITLLGEAYTGVNTAAYYGAISHHDCVNELKSRGGWINLTYDPNGPLAFSLGGGLDDLCDEEKNYLANLPDIRSQNAFEFGLVTYALSSNTQFGFEISHWQTKYRNPSPNNARIANDLRLQWSVQSAF
jgi:hypothetical protein